MACFDCEPNYCFMKGLNSEGTPKVMQFSATYSPETPKFTGISNFPGMPFPNSEGTAFMTCLYDTILGMTFNSAGYRTSSFEGLTTGALYTPQPAVSGAGVGPSPDGAM
jgi:hypothetical protein